MSSRRIQVLQNDLTTRHCHKCGKLFDDVREAQQHINLSDCKGMLSSQCHQCYEVFGNRYQLRQHECSPVSQPVQYPNIWPSGASYVSGLELARAAEAKLADEREAWDQERRSWEQERKSWDQERVKLQKAAIKRTMSVTIAHECEASSKVAELQEDILNKDLVIERLSARVYELQCQIDDMEANVHGGEDD